MTILKRLALGPRNLEFTIIKASDLLIEMLKVPKGKKLLIAHTQEATCISQKTITFYPYNISSISKLLSTN
jgi:hypothetical protein